MIVTFSYPLPDELYVEGVSGKVKATYTYRGPETFDVHINSFGFVDDIDVHNDPELGQDYRKTIDPNKNPEVAYMLSHYFDDEYNWQYKYEDEIMENGDVYKKILNPDLRDAYQLSYDFDKNDWQLVQIVKLVDNPAAQEAKARKRNIEKYSSKYSFGDELDILAENYILELDEFIQNNPPLKTWKYINFELNSVPKLPSAIAAEIAKLPSEGV
jgi:hypothetical protein